MSDKSKFTLDDLLNQAVYSIPDYQRGYSWEKEQVKELADDISNCVQNGAQSSHYMGTIITYDTKAQQKYLSVQKPVKEIVDGQQRLISLSLFLSVVLNKLKENQSNTGENEYDDSEKRYLYSFGRTRIRLHDDSDNDFYLNLLKNGGMADIKPNSFTTARLLATYRYLNRFISKQTIEEVERIYDVITSRMIFTVYEVGGIDEVGMTFELVNNRGKQLTKFELFKNYLLYWCYRNISVQEDREELTLEINRSWKTVYENINEIKANDGLADTFLKYVYVILSGNVSWDDGYKQLKSYIPINRNDDETRNRIDGFLKYLASYSRLFQKIKLAETDDKLNQDELSREKTYLSAIDRSGYADNFMPILLVSRHLLMKGQIEPANYLELVRAIDCFIYRVYLIAGFRSNYRRNSFYTMAFGLFAFSFEADNESVCEKVNNIVFQIKIIQNISLPSDGLKAYLEEARNWFDLKSFALKFTLYEYEKWLIQQKYPNSSLMLRWEDLEKNMTREHILPQTPTDYWLDRWDEKDIEIWVHDIGNILLTLDNSAYSNHPYPRKCLGEDENGNKVTDRYYADSELKQEREMVKYKEWTVNEVKQRHSELVEFILKRWPFD